MYECSKKSARREPKEIEHPKINLQSYSLNEIMEKPFGGGTKEIQTQKQKKRSKHTFYKICETYMHGKQIKSIYPIIILGIN